MNADARRSDDPRPTGSRHPVLRWIVRLLIVAVILLAVVFLAVQVVLWTSVPKSIVISKVEEGMGLRMGAARLSTNWLGHTSMGGVKLALPLSDKSFVDVPTMHVTHTNLLGILLGWPVRIKSIELDQPVIYVQQDSTGRWNLQEVAELLARSAGKQTGQQTAQTSSTPALPQLNVKAAMIVVVDNRHHQAKIEPVNVTGTADTPVSWKYGIEVPSASAGHPAHFSLLGRVAPGGLWAHEADVWVHDITPWIQVWAPGFNTPIAFNGHWQGQLNANGLDGFLQIADSQYGDYHAVGNLTASRTGSVVAINPRNLQLRMMDATKPTGPPSLEVNVPNGTIEYDGKVARANQVQLSLLGGPATFNGWFNPDLRQGALEAFWQNLVVPKAGIKQSGKLNVAFSRPVAANLAIDVVASSSGSFEGSPYEASMKLNVSGPRLTDLTWNVTTPQLAWHRPQPIQLDGLTAVGAFTYDTKHAGKPEFAIVRLNSVALPADNRLAGTGAYNLITRQGHLHLEGQDWPAHVIQGTKLAFVVDAMGKGVPSNTDPKVTRPYVELTQFALQSGDASLTMKGTYDGRDPKPVNVQVELINKPGLADAVDQPTIVHGYIDGSATLTGTLAPRAIEIQGSLEGRDASLLGHPIGNLVTKVHGAIDGEKAFVRADGIPFLDGVWSLGATYVQWQGENYVDATEVDLGVDHLPLRRVSEFLKAPAVDGTFGGHWSVYFPRLKPDPAKIRVAGTGQIRHFAASDLVADDVTFSTSLQDGHIKADPIRLRQGNYGRIDAKADMDLSNWRQVNAGITFNAFPITVPQAALTLQLYGQSNGITVLLPDSKAKDPAARQLRADASLSLRSTIALREQAEGEVRIQLGMHGRIIRLGSAQGDLLGGTFHADGVTDLDRPNQSRASLYWAGIQSERAVRLYPQLKGLGGQLAGNARLAPATVPRPLEPLAFDVYLRPINTRWHSVELGNGEIHGFIGGHPQQVGEQTARMIHVVGSDRQPSTLHVGGGAVDVWFSTTSHLDRSPTASGQEIASGVTISNQLNLAVRDLDVDQFVRAYDPHHVAGFGRLDGTLFMLSAPNTRTLLNAAQALATGITAQTGGAAGPTPPQRAPKTKATAPAASAKNATTATAPPADFTHRLLATTTVDGNITLRNSNLANFTPIAFLFDIMRLGNDKRTPTGHGTMSFHMEQGTLHVSNLYYFNRGIEVRGVATVDRTWDLPNCPVHGAAIGTARPLKNIKLPLFAEADAIMTGLQGQLTSVTFDNTLLHPGNFQSVALNQVGSELRGILLGELGQNSQ